MLTVFKRDALPRVDAKPGSCEQVNGRIGLSALNFIPTSCGAEVVANSDSSEAILDLCRCRRSRYSAWHFAFAECGE